MKTSQGSKRLPPLSAFYLLRAEPVNASMAYSCYLLVAHGDIIFELLSFGTISIFIKHLGDFSPTIRADFSLHFINANITIVLEWNVIFIPHFYLPKFSGH